MPEFGSFVHVAAALVIPPGPSIPGRLPVERKVSPAPDSPPWTRVGKQPGTPHDTAVYADAETSAPGCSAVAIGVSVVSYAAVLPPFTNCSNPSASRAGSSRSSDTSRVTTDSPRAVRVKENLPIAIDV